MANDLIPYKRPGEDVTVQATDTITGKRCVQITGPKTSAVSSGGVDVGLDTTASGGAYQVGHPDASGAAGAGKRCFGVAKYDAAETGFFGVARGGILPIESSDDIDAGDEVEVASDGTVVPLASGTPIGLCLNDCTDGDDAEIAWYET